ncbi:uncharacterized protein LOC136751998 isoform X2 [Amia ocellicauda]|uniref:uncharacterized protein LOC136751998 isoform X2 n=1 Tax=Amia ocellicauda TaxID=2972642 RepID=UPI003464C398
MALVDGGWEELREQLALLSGRSSVVVDVGPTVHQYSHTGLLHLSDEVLVLILRLLDPVSLLRVGSTCRTLFRVCSCCSLWSRLLQASFGVSFTTATISISAKHSFRLLFMWRTLYTNLHCNRSLQEKLFTERPPPKYWVQWLVLEERVPLPPVRLPDCEIEKLWGIGRESLEGKCREAEDGDGNVLKMEWKELFNLNVQHHGSVANILQYVLHQQEENDHRDLEALYQQYTQFRFQWHFSYWLFKQPKPFDRQLRMIFLQWQGHSKQKVSGWGSPICNLKYLASLHHITLDYWRGKLANGDENAGIRTVENYFSMCKSLVAWILGQNWGRFKRRKVYLDTLEGVHRMLKKELHTSVIDHKQFWQVAKVQMARVCKLEETAVNYVNWRMIDAVPYYRLYMVSGCAVYLEHIKVFLRRKRLIHDWIFQEENTWVRRLLSEDLYLLLQFDTKISEGNLHGDSLSAHLSRIIWLYLHSGQQLYMEAVKGFVQHSAQARLGYCVLVSVSPGFYSPSVN